jgi:hypothetical protein
MTSKTELLPKVAVSLLLSLGLMSHASLGQAQERVEMEQLQATTQALLEAMVESGLLTRDKVNALLAAAKAKAKAAPAAPAVSPEAAADVGKDVGKDGKKIVRVPYVPEAVKTEMREQIKREVLVQARNERWGEPGATPEWTNRIKIEGDFRLREEAVRLSGDNTAPGMGTFASGEGALTRAADIATSKGTNPVVNPSPPNFNTQDDYERLRLRARIGVTASLTDEVSATLRLSTGGTTDRTSTNQTLGQSFNKYAVVVDQAYVSLKPTPELTLSGGRMPNPFFSTDLVWADDLGFEGIAASAQKPLFTNGSGFLAAGYFPLSAEVPGTSNARSLLGVQGGIDVKLPGSGNQLKLGLALYDYRGIEGKKEDAVAMNLAPNYGTRYEYAAGFRQRGNTLFRVNAADNSSTTYYGLASSFRELNLTAALDLPNLLSKPLRVTADYVKNLGFSRSEMQERTGVAITDGSDTGYLAKVQMGPTALRRGDWNASLAYRYLGSDAVLDAFTNSDFGMGGTNNKGLILGANYGLYNHTVVSARWMSSNQIDSYAPGAQPGTKLSVDTIQLDLTTRY